MTTALPVPEGLREYFNAHNRRALWLAVGALLLGLAVWGGLWLVVQWGGLLLLTIIHGVQTPAEPHFLPAYLVLATGLLLLRWVVTHIFHYCPDRTDPLSGWKFLLDVLLLPGNLLPAIPGNFHARIHPPEEDMQAAWYLLRKLHAVEKISLQQLPLEVPDAARLERLRTWLGLLGLTETDRYGDTWWLHLKDDQARRLVRRWESAGAPA